MTMDKMEWNILEQTFESLVNGQKKELLRLGRRLVPSLTEDDMLQPNDFPILENHPEFRYEEGVLAGIMTAHMALRAIQPK